MHFPHVKRAALDLIAAGHNDLPCLFPRHGLGKKHERPIVLGPWQAAIVDTAPWRGQWDVRINQRPSVALMVEHLGLKA
jgi:hypothetical protein